MNSKPSAAGAVQLSAPARIRHAMPTTIRRRGVETRLVIADAPPRSGTTGVDATLVKAIVRGRQWFEALARGKAGSIAEIAQAEGVTVRYVGRLLPLAFLAPDIVQSVLAGTQPAHLTTELLPKRAELSLSWEEQKALLGFS